MAAVTSFQEDDKAIRPTFRYAEVEAHPRKVFFAPFHAIGVNMRLSFIKESAKHGYAGYYILLRRSRRLYAELKINNKKLGCG